ncbi:synaptonemal complex protein 2-like [Patagioenas fasciata monilis]|uniref:Synaptonemal complex protein 2-like n=1 Tax=Patagioenas fasciata monilis TaxID=372326 RepID=A0A1V4JWL6_PATFA|nr:synaptonemal complex protein 2-like [Patagioenas fasciata monilis]
MAQLESLLTDAFKGKGFQKISELLQEREIELPQKYSESLLSHLDKALRKELDKNEFQNVSLLLKCIQLYFKSDLQEGTSLFVEQGLVEKLVSWFERARTFVTVIDPEKNKFLMSLLEDFFDSALVKLELPDEYGSVVYFCKSSRAITLCYAGGGYLSCAYVYHIDYDLQVALSEALCRLMTKKWRDDLVHHWFEDNYLAEAFKEIKDREFETVKKPSDEKLEEFWIDFNTGSQSVTFYVDSNEGALWDSVRLSKDAVSGYSLTEDDGEKIVKIYMKIPAAFNKTEATKIKISFSAEFEILSILRKVLGDEKMMINVPEEESIHAGKPANQNEAVIPVSTDPQHGKDPSNSENTETVFDKASQQSQQLTGTVAVAEAKAKILGQKASSQKQSNNENTSTGQSEKSWILDAQKQPLPKSLDYTRKRPRVRSRLKVLPMSSASSGSDDQMKKRASRQKAQKEEMPGKKSTPSSNGDDLPTVNLSDEAPSEIEGSPLLLDVPDMGSFSDAEATQKFLDVSGKSSREEESTKRKDSDILSGTIIKKPKLSSWETSNLFSDISHKPRKLFNSEENEEEFQPGQEMDDSVDNASFSKMLNEDFTDSGMIAAFENFISQLKKSLWSRYKRMEATAQNALRASEKNVSTLLNQILESRLSKLETLQKIVAEELANLEKETQILTNMEKDAVVCTTSCVPAHKNSVC